MSEQKKNAENLKLFFIIPNFTKSQDLIKQTI